MRQLQAQWCRDQVVFTEMTLCIAEGFRERQKGLLGKPWLQPHEGLLLSPCNSIHMWFMRQALDVVYLTRSRRVCKLVLNLPPWRISGCWRAHSVVELTAGAAEKWGLKVGDYLQWELP